MARWLRAAESVGQRLPLIVNQDRRFVREDGMREFAKVQAEGETLLRRIGLTELADRYAQSFLVHGMLGYDTRTASGILDAAIALVNGGFVGNLLHKVHAEYGVSLAEDARQLLKAGNLHGAGALGRIVLEQWIRDTAERAKIAGHDGAKASVVLNACKEASLFPLARWRQIQAHLDTGNDAAHGKSLDLELVTNLLDFVDRHCTTTD